MHPGQLITLLLLGPSAQAQELPPSPARLCADAAAGTEVEVCLRLATTHPEEVDAIAVALRGHVDRSGAPDRELLGAFLQLLSEDAGVEGARLLGELGDPRAVHPLVHIAETGELEVALAAVEALSSYQDAIEPFSRWLVERDLPVEVRISAARALGRLGTDECADVLLGALRRRRVPPPLRSAMITTLEASFPDRLGEVDRPVTADGSGWVAASGAWGLGYTLSAAGYFSQYELAVLGAAAGVVTGGTAGWVMGRAWPVEAHDAAFITTTGVATTAGGMLVGDALVPGGEGDWDGALVGGLVGEGLGFGAGLLLSRAYQGRAADSLEALGIASGVALAVGLGMDFAAGDRDSEVRWAELAAGIGLVGGLGLGHLAAPALEPTHKDAWMISLATVYGSAVGATFPVGDLDRRGLPVATASLGALVGYALSAPLEPRTNLVFGGYAGMVYGGAFGMGLGLLVDPTHHPEGDVVQGATLAGITIGLGTGVWASWRDPDPFDPRDGVLVGLVTAWTGWQAVGWEYELQPSADTLGWYLMVPAACGAATALVSPVTDVPISASFAAGSMGLWGGYVTGAAAQLAGAERPLRYGLAGSNVGMTLGVVSSLPPISMPPLVMGLADAGGILGGSLAALGASWFTSDIDTILATSLVGALVGFGAGGTVGLAIRHSGTTRDVAFLGNPQRLPGVWTVMPTALSDGERHHWGAVLEVSGW